MRCFLARPAATSSNKIGVFCRFVKAPGVKLSGIPRLFPRARKRFRKAEGDKGHNREDVGQRVCDERVVDPGGLLRRSRTSRFRTLCSPDNHRARFVESVCALSNPPQAAAMSVAVGGQPQQSARQMAAPMTSFGKAKLRPMGSTVKRHPRHAQALAGARAAWKSQR